MFIGREQLLVGRVSMDDTILRTVYTVDSRQHILVFPLKTLRIAHMDDESED